MKFRAGGTAQNRSPTLGRTQAKSVVVNLVTNGLIAAQSLVVLLFLSVREIGLLGIATGIGSLALVAQQFGLGAATLKEVSVASDRGSAYQTMIAGLALRVVMTVPVSLLLIALSGWLADDVYGHPEIQGPLIIFAAIILLYGVVDVLSYTLQGLQLWQRFFAQKLVGVVVSTAVVIAATAAFGLDGYFAGLLAGTLATTAVAAVVVSTAFGRKILATRPRGLRRRARAMLRLGVAAYGAKILQVLALQAPILVAGYVASAEDTGALKVALTIGTIVLGLSGAVNTVNIAVFSKRFADADQGAGVEARRQVGLYTVLSAGLAAAIATVGPDAVTVFGSQYEGTTDAIVLGVVGAALYGILGIVVSTVYIPVGEYGRFVVVYLIPAVVASGGALAAAWVDRGIALFAGALALGAAAGVAFTFADLARRALLPLQASMAVTTMVVVGVVGMLEAPQLVRYALLPVAILACALMIRSLLAPQVA